MFKHSRFALRTGVIVLSFGAIALSGCAKPSSQTDFVLLLRKDIGHTSKVGQAIDLDRYVEATYYQGATYRVSFQGVSEDLSNHIYYPQKAGQYDFTYSNVGKSVDFSIDVSPVDMNLTLNETPLSVLVGRSMSDEDIIAEAAALASPLDATISLDHIEYRPFVFDEGGPKGEWRTYEHDEGVTTFADAGFYRAYIKATSGEQSIISPYSLIALTSRNNGNSIVLKDKNGGYISNSIVTSPDDEHLLYLPKASSDGAGAYAILNHEFAWGEGISLTFKGKSLPQIGLRISAGESAKNPYSLGNVKGYIMSLETPWPSDVAVHGPNGLSDTIWQSTFWLGPHFGMNDFQSDKYYKFTTEMSQVGQEGSDGRMGKHYSINVYEITDYGLPSESAKLIYVDPGYGWMDAATKDTGVYFGLYASKTSDCFVKVEYEKQQIEDNVYLYNGYSNSDVSKREVYLSPLSQSIGGADNPGVSAHGGYLAFDGEYGLGSTATFDFKGKNIPDVALFCDSVSGPTGGKGIYLSAGEKGSFFERAFAVNGPSRLDPGSSQGISNYSSMGFNGLLSLDGSSPFGYASLQDDIHYRYVVSSKESKDGQVCIVLSLYDIGDEKNWQRLGYREFTVPYHETLSGKIIAYGGLMRGAHFIYHSINEVEESVEEPERISFSSPSFSLMKGTTGSLPLEGGEGFNVTWISQDANVAKVQDGVVTGVAVGNTKVIAKIGTKEASIEVKVIENPAFPELEPEHVYYRAKETSTGEVTILGGTAANKTDLSYLAIPNVCERGMTLELDFQGKNIPSFCFFADSLDGQPIGGGTGIFVRNSAFDESFTWAGDSASSLRNAYENATYVCGPMRWAPNRSGDIWWPGNYIITDGANGTSCISRSQLNETNDYHLSVSIDGYSRKNGSFTIRFVLQNKTDNTSRTFVSSGNYYGKYPGVRFSSVNTNLLLYGQEVDISFRYSLQKSTIGPEPEEPTIEENFQDETLDSNLLIPSNNALTIQNGVGIYSTSGWTDYLGGKYPYESWELSFTARYHYNNGGSGLMLLFGRDSSAIDLTGPVIQFAPNQIFYTENWFANPVGGTLYLSHTKFEEEFVEVTVKAHLNGMVEVAMGSQHFTLNGIKTDGYVGFIMGGGGENPQSVEFKHLSLKKLAED